MIKWIKISFLFLLLLGACYLFGATCQKASQAFALLLSPDRDLINFVIFFLIAFCTVIVAVGLVVILIKPFLLAVLSFFLASMTLLIGWGRFSGISIFFSTIFFLINLGLTALTRQSMEGRIKFSVQTFTEKRGMIVFALVLLICGGFYLGGKNYVEENGFEIPDKYFELFINPIKESALSQIPEEERETTEAGLDEEFEELIQNFQETKVKPIEPYITLLLTVILFFPLYTVMNLTAIIPVVLLDLLFRILISLKFVQVVTEDKPVERVVFGD